MISMLLVGRLVRRVDARLLILVGLLLTSWSLWRMTGFMIGIGTGPVITTGIVQGLGLVFVPLSTLAFGTLEALPHGCGQPVQPGAQPRPAGRSSLPSECRGPFRRHYRPNDANGCNPPRLGEIPHNANVRSRVRPAKWL